jgi:hypothetical protein
MWKLIETPKVRQVTHALANKFRDMEPAPGDRPLRDNRVEALKKAVIGKQFRTCEWASAYCKATKKVYRVNGKHTSTLMSELNGETKSLSVIEEHYHCDTLDDVAALYATFDTRNSARSTGDINAIFAGACPELADVDKVTINSCVSGMATAIWGDTTSKWNITPETRAGLLAPNASFVLWINEMCHGVRGQERSIIRRSPVIAAIFQTYQKDKKAAAEFWLLVRDGSGDKHTSPDRKLNKFLLTSRLGLINRKNSPTHNTVGYREMRVKCLHAWNAWRRGATTDLRFYTDADDPKVI